MSKFSKIFSLVVVLAVVFSLTACATGASQSNPPAATTASASTPAPTKAAGSGTVNLYSNLGSDPSIQILIDAFKAATGIEINNMVAPTVTDELKAKLTTMLASSDDSIDVMWVDELMGVTFSKAGYFEAIDDIMTPEVIKNYSADIIKRIDQCDGKTYMIPMTTDVMYFWCNKDLFAQANLQPPTTQEEFLTAGKALTKGDIYGFGASWAKGGYLFNDAIRFINQFEGDYLDWTKPGTKDGLQFMYDLIYKYGITPEAAIGETYDAMNQKFEQGKYAMMFQWTYVATGLKDKFPGTLDVFPVPKYINNSTASAGWHMAMNVNAKNKAEGKELMKFFAAKEGQTVFTKILTKSAASKEVLNDESLVKDLPMLKYAGQYATAGSLVPRPMNSKINQIMEVTEALISSYLSKQISIDECLTTGQEELNKLLK